MIIFGARFSRTKPRQDEAAKRSKRWKRAALLTPVLVGLSFVAVVEGGYPAAGKAGTTKGGLFAALADPLSLFADRSPGGRGAGPLLSTKPPHERVLSEVRDRDPDPGIAPGIDPVFGLAPDGLVPGGGDPPGDGPPADGVFPGDSFGGGTGSAPPFNPGQSGFLPFSQGPAAPSGPGPGIGAIPEPATWAMLILGFFAVGAAMRRRARKLAGAVSVP
jgi:hypothetical protein